MKELLKKLKLLDHMTTTLQLSKQEFVSRLSAITDPGDANAWFSPLEAFSSSKNEFKGQITHDTFTLKRRRKMFDNNFAVAVANGKMSESNNQTTVEAEINGFGKTVIVFYVFVLLFYCAVIVGTYLSDDKGGFAILFMLVHATFATLIIYFVTKKSVAKMKHELERDFFYLTKNP